MGDPDRHERDFIRLAVIAVIVLAVVIGLGLISVYGPVHSTFGPMEDDHVEIVSPSQ